MAEAQAQIYKIYKITSPQTDKVYIGSTKQTLKYRFSHHKSGAKHKGKYYSSFDLIQNYSDCEIELIQEVEVDQRYIRERYWIEFYQDKCVNERIPIRTKEETREHQREYYEANREQIREHQRAYRSENRDQIKENQREFYEANREQIREHQREYYEANREQINAKITCECGSKITRGYMSSYMSKHRKTMKHLKFVQSITNQSSLDVE
jgi:hypothetical protein